MGHNLDTFFFFLVFIIYLTEAPGIFLWGVWALTHVGF